MAQKRSVAQRKNVDRKPRSKDMKNLGVGIGLRRPHFEDFLKRSPQVDWLEVISENFMQTGGRNEKVLAHVLKSYPVVCHGVELSLGSLDPFNETYLSQLEELLKRTHAPWFSDHLCFTSHGKIHFHDLIPTLRTEESVDVISEKILKLQKRMQRPFALENISYYLESPHHEMTEPEFISQIVKRTGCFLLLDVNNVYVNSQNLGFDPLTYLKNLPLTHVIQIHLAGYYDRKDVLIDTHGDFVSESVWQLYRETLTLLKRPVSTLIEWDNDLPPLSELEQEVEKARAILRETL